MKDGIEMTEDLLGVYLSAELEGYVQKRDAFATVNSQLARELVELLTERGQTITAAESCTGGLFASYITDIPGASKVFQGSVVSYAEWVKVNRLGVDPRVLDKYTAVSSQTAKQMADGARNVFASDLSVSITGVAGPGPDDRGNPEGLVYICVDDGNLYRWSHFIWGDGRHELTRREARELSVCAAFSLVLYMLTADKQYSKILGCIYTEAREFL